MTGAQMKSLFQNLYGYKWAKNASRDLKVSRFTVQRLAIMASIPTTYERKIGEVLRRKA